jgi:two-component system, NtrC family, response regulator AtoC
MGTDTPFGDRVAAGRETLGLDAAGRRGEECRILLVDDDANYLDTLVLALESAFPPPDYRIDVAPNAPKAVELIDACPYDLVVTDMHMPGPTDGLAVVDAAGARFGGSFTIVLTAYGDLTNVYEAVTRGAAFYVDKKMERAIDLLVYVMQLGVMQNGLAAAWREMSAALREYRRSSGL